MSLFSPVPDFHDVDCREKLPAGRRQLASPYTKSTRASTVNEIASSWTPLPLGGTGCRLADRRGVSEIQSRVVPGCVRRGCLM